VTWPGGVASVRAGRIEGGRMEAAGVLAVGESTTAMAYVKGRRGVSPRQVKAVLLVCMLGIGIPAARWLSGSWLTATLSVECALIGLARAC
jgi:hypothetical protein